MLPNAKYAFLSFSIKDYILPLKKQNTNKQTKKLNPVP